MPFSQSVPAVSAAGCDGYIAKPMHYQEFLATVAAQLARH
jgi:DNA-binding response OmpR family regulator